MTRVLALLLGVVLAGVVLAAGLWLTGFSVIDSGPYFEFGFRACYEAPKTRPNDWCGTNNGGPRSRDWLLGPHSGFDKLDPAEIAENSLGWFTISRKGSEWQGNPTAHLEFVYPSGSLRVTARYAPHLRISWEQQLRLWFERFPPSSGESTEPDESGFNWSVKFKDRGEVRGHRASDALSVEAISAVLANRGDAPTFQEPTCSLGYSIRTSSHSMNCYSVDTDHIEEVEQLPLRLREKITQRRGG
jgi:hypothetical protein